MVNGNPCSVIDSDTVRGIAFLVDKTPGERADGFHDARLLECKSIAAYSSMSASCLGGIG